MPAKEAEESVKSLKARLTKAEKRVAELEDENSKLRSQIGPFGTAPDAAPVFGPDAVPLESR